MRNFFWYIPIDPSSLKRGWLGFHIVQVLSLPSFYSQAEYLCDQIEKTAMKLNEWDIDHILCSKYERNAKAVRLSPQPKGP